MSQKGACLWVELPQADGAPCARYKHACCSTRGQVYLLGGRATRPLRDMWRYSMVRNEWTELPCDGDGSPEEVEEHSMVAHEGLLYVFGGMLDSGFTQQECPLWVFDTVKQQWQPSQKKTSCCLQPPNNRKSHSAVVMDSAMFLYGGYVDMKGSSQDLWRLDLDTGCWSLMPGRGGGPGPRHGHSCVAHQGSMYLYGGLRGLREQGDLWRWAAASDTWSCLRTPRGPGRLVGHSGLLLGGHMLLFGGAQSQASGPLGALWSFSLSSHRWSRLEPASTTPPPSMHHCCLGLGTPAPASPTPATGGAMELQPLSRGGSEEEQHLPDLLLLLGGRPLRGGGIAVWYMLC